MNVRGNSQIGELYLVSKKVHHGQLIKEYLDKYGYNISAVARNCNRSKQAMNGWFKKARWTEEMLELVSDATNHDFHSELFARSDISDVHEEQGSYGRNPDMQIVFNINFDDEEAVKRAAQLMKISKRK